MQKSAWIRTATTLALLATLIAIVGVGGMFVLHWAKDAAQARMNSMGLVVLSETAPYQSLVAFLPGDAPYRTPPADQTIGVDFAIANGLAEMRRCVARLGKCDSVVLENMSAIHDPDAAAILDAALPGTVSLGVGTVDPGLIAAIVRPASVASLFTHHASFTPAALAGLAGDQTLAFAHINSATLDAPSLAGLMSAGKLTSLTLRDVRFDVPGDWSANASPSLTTLMLAGSTVPPPRAAEWIGGMTGLTHLHLQNIEGTTFPPETFAKLPRLVQLGVSVSQIDDAWLQRLPTLPHVEYINVSESPVTIAGLQSLIERLPALKQISVSECRFQGSDVAALRATHPTVEIELWPCPSATGK